MVETNQNESSPKKPEKWEWLPFGEGVRKGAIVGAFGYVVWLLVKFLGNNFLDATEWARALVIYLLNMGSVANLLSLRGFVVVAVSIAVLLPMLWLLGHMPLQTMEDYVAKVWGKVFKKKKEKKFLFCIKMKDKSFFGGYPIGFVSQIVLWKDGKIYYHTWWPGLFHFTLPFVRPEDVERLDIPVRAVLKIYMSGGAL